MINTNNAAVNNPVYTHFCVGGNVSSSFISSNRIVGPNVKCICSYVVLWLSHFHLHFSSVQSLSRVQLFATPWAAARQASLSITNSRSSLRLTSIESEMPSSHLILCRPLLLLPPIPPSIRVFSNEICTITCTNNGYWTFEMWPVWIEITISRKCLPDSKDLVWKKECKNSFLIILNIDYILKLLIFWYIRLNINVSVNIKLKLISN